MSKKTQKDKLIKFADFDPNDPFSGWESDKERIKYMKTSAYKDMDLAESFATYYGVAISKETKKNDSVNVVTTIEVGNIYLGTVKSFGKNELTFSIPGVKEELVAMDNFNSCIDEVNNYLLTHDNTMLFEVREHRQNKYMVSVAQGNYRYWMAQLDRCINKEVPINVHIDTLVRGGFMGHTNIDQMCEITGKEYTNSVFIPGSQIVLNIESDFEKWVGQDIQMIPQKVVDFKKDFKTGQVEKSIVGSRKRLLQIVGNDNLYELYTQDMIGQKLGKDYVSPRLEGTVTGIINSQKKTGVFVELDGKYITGLMPVSQKELVNYKPGDPVYVRIKQYETQEGKEPFVTNKAGKMVKCNARPVFEVA